MLMKVAYFGEMHHYWILYGHIRSEDSVRHTSWIYGFIHYDVNTSYCIAQNCMVSE
jgi:hypothetical protein